MYAVVATGGKQYKVKEGEVLRVEKLSGDVGQEISFDKVLMFSDGESVKIGQPLVDGVTVRGHIVDQAKAKKLLYLSTNAEKDTEENKDTGSNTRL